MKGAAPQNGPADVRTNDLLRKFDMDELLNCMHCGFCLPSCPTYQETGLETYSPRGRIGLMKGVAEGKLPLDEEFEEHMYACLGCRACETACPAGVKYGRLIETAREVVEDEKRARGRQSFTRRMVFRGFFNRPERVRQAGTLLWTLQALGLQGLATKTGLDRMLPREMREMQTAVDRIASPAARKQRPRVIPAQTPASVKRVGLFTGCIMDELFFETNQAMARVLSKLGYDVVFVDGQACCGALHAHSGEKPDATGLARRNIDAFERAQVDIVVNNAGGCGAALREYEHWLSDDPDFVRRAEAFVDRVRDFNELVAESGPLPFQKSLDARVTYQDSCHLAHGQGVRRQPRDLIKSIPGVDYVELAKADTCCGSAGIYNITNWDMSMRVLDDKMGHVEKTNAHIVVTSNPGCLLQMKKGIERAGLAGKMEAVHIVDLLDGVL